MASSITSQVTAVAQHTLGLPVSETQLVPHKALRPFLDDLQKHVSEHFETHEEELQKHLDNKDTEGLWKIWNSAVAGGLE
eukprot:5999736-Karenia_brevis.AAC.1